MSADPNDNNSDPVPSKRIKLSSSQDASGSRHSILSSILIKELSTEINCRKADLDVIEEKLFLTKKYLLRVKQGAVADYYKQKNEKEKEGLQYPPHPAVKDTFIGKSPSGLSKFKNPSTDYSNSNKQSTSKQDELPVLEIKKEPTETISENETSQNGAGDENGLEVPTYLGPNIPPVKELCTMQEPRSSLEKVKIRVIVGNVSKWLSSEIGETTHKWTVYIKTADKNFDLSSVIDKVKFFLHSSYKPNDVITVEYPPYKITRRGWGEFPLRVQFYFKNSLDLPLDIVHNIKLDQTCSGLETFGSETSAEIWVHTPSSDNYINVRHNFSQHNSSKDKEIYQRKDLFIKLENLSSEVNVISSEKENTQTSNNIKLLCSPNSVNVQSGSSLLCSLSSELPVTDNVKESDDPLLRLADEYDKFSKELDSLDVNSIQRLLEDNSMYCFDIKDEQSNNDVFVKEEKISNGFVEENPINCLNLKEENIDLDSKEDGTNLVAHISSVIDVNKTEPFPAITDPLNGELYIVPQNEFDVVDSEIVVETVCQEEPSLIEEYNFVESEVVVESEFIEESEVVGLDVVQESEIVETNVTGGSEILDETVAVVESEAAVESQVGQDSVIDIESELVAGTEVVIDESEVVSQESEIIETEVFENVSEEVVDLEIVHQSEVVDTEIQESSGLGAEVVMNESEVVDSEIVIDSEGSLNNTKNASLHSDYLLNCSANDSFRTNAKDLNLFDNVSKVMSNFESPRCNFQNGFSSIEELPTTSVVDNEVTSLPTNTKTNLDNSTTDRVSETTNSVHNINVLPFKSISSQIKTVNTSPKYILLNTSPSKLFIKLPTGELKEMFYSPVYSVSSPTPVKTSPVVPTPATSKSSLRKIESDVPIPGRKPTLISFEKENGQVVYCKEAKVKANVNSTKTSSSKKVQSGLHKAARQGVTNRNTTLNIAPTEPNTNQQGRNFKINNKFYNDTSKKVSTSNSLTLNGNNIVVLTGNSLKSNKTPIVIQKKVIPGVSLLKKPEIRIQPNVQCEAAWKIDERELLVRCPTQCTEFAVNWLIKKFPLIDSRADIKGFRCVHPYCVSRKETFFNWSFPKQRAAEWMRAKAIVKIVNKIPNLKQWSTLQVRDWARLRCYTPLTVKMVKESEYRNPEPEFSYTPPYEDLERVISKAKTIQETEIVDVCSIDDPGEETNKREERKEARRRWTGKDLHLPLEPELTGLKSFIDGTFRSVKAEVDVEELAPRATYPAAHRLLMSAFFSAAEDLIRRSHTASMIRHSDNSPSELTVEDVQSAVLSRKDFDFLLPNRQIVCDRPPVALHKRHC